MSFFFFNDTATTEIYTLSLHDALPISHSEGAVQAAVALADHDTFKGLQTLTVAYLDLDLNDHGIADRKSTRLNSSHGYISYAVFCLKKKNIHINPQPYSRRRLSVLITL